MTCYTFVVRFEDGQEPRVGADTEILGGKLEAVCFDDALVRIDVLEEEINKLRRNVFDPTTGY